MATVHVLVSSSALHFMFLLFCYFVIIFCFHLTASFISLLPFLVQEPLVIRVSLQRLQVLGNRTRKKDSQKLHNQSYNSDKIKEWRSQSAKP